MIDSKKLAGKILTADIKHTPHGYYSDCIAVMLASYLSKSIYNPHDGEMDNNATWEKWVIDQVDLFEKKKIIEIIEKELNK